MIPAFIVLLVIACALGGYIAYTVLRDKKIAACADADIKSENAAADVVPDADESVSAAEAASNGGSGEA